jgi:hypothetical protein
MTGNEERFLQEIATRLPLTSIVEVHLFAPLRQGGMESGVAIIAAEAEPELGAAVAAGEGPEAQPQAAGDRLQARFVVHTARYRHTQKGEDRGRWEFEIAEEANPPLLAIDRVVSGVLHRSGEQREPVRLSGEDLRTNLGRVDWIASKQ